MAVDVSYGCSRRFNLVDDVAGVYPVSNASSIADERPFEGRSFEAGSGRLYGSVLGRRGGRRRSRGGEMNWVAGGGAW